MAEVARLAIEKWCSRFVPGGCVVTVRCDLLFRQTSASLVALAALLPESSAPALLRDIAAGAVSGIPPTASVSQDEMPLASPPVGASAYLIARTLTPAACVDDVAACRSLLAAGGFDAGNRTLSCYCSAARASGFVTVSISPADGVSQSALGAAVANVFGACVRVYTPAAEAAAGDVLVYEVCPRGVPKASPKALLGLLGLVGLVPLALCFWCFCFTVRRRRKARTMQLAVMAMTSAPVVSGPP